MVTVTAVHRQQVGSMVGTYCGPDSKVSRKVLAVQYNWNQCDALGKYAKFLER